MATPPQDLYNVQTTHKIFFVSSLALIAGLVWMTWKDYDREWKGYQRDFNRLEYARIRKQIAAETQRIRDEAAKAGLEKQLAEAKELLRTGKPRREALAETSRLARGDYYTADRAAKDTKALSDAQRYVRNEALHALEEAEREKAPPARLEEARRRSVEEEDNLRELEDRLAKKLQAAEQAELAMNAAKAALDDFLRQVDAAAARQAALERDRKSLERRARLINASNPLYQARNAPVVDFVDPNITITDKQKIIPQIQDDYNFTKVPKVDRCKVCHLAIDNPKFAAESGAWKRRTKGRDGKEEETPATGWHFRDPELQQTAEEVFADPDRRETMIKVLRTHPRPDLYLSSASPHPFDTVGCTVCHQGDGRSLTFTTAAHTPDSPGQEEEWKRKYDWESLHHWDFPMLARRYAQASCQQCHKGQAEIAGAAKWQEGRRLVERIGCFGCHKTEGLELRSAERPDGERKVGPSLLHLAEKVKPEWAYHWIMNPKDFRPSTRMPRIFGLSNMREEGFDTADVEVASVVRYLFHVSRPAEAGGEAPPGPGDADKGKALIEKRGCLACHRLESPADDTSIERWTRLDAFGPPLAGVGSKTTHAWLYNWIRDPKRLSPLTKMPNLRLSKDEAADIAAYLMTLKNPAFEQKVAAAPNPESDRVFAGRLEDLTREYLRGKYPRYRVDDPKRPLWQDFCEQEVWAAAKQRENLAGPISELIARLPKKEDRDAAQGEFQALLDTVSYADTGEARAARVDAIAKALAPHLAGDLGTGLPKACETLKAGLDAVHRSLEPLPPVQWQELYVGERTILRQGCFGCHENIRGFEKAVPIGVELSGKQAIGSKNILKFDFGFATFARTREEWIKHKLLDPRQFDLIDPEAADPARKDNFLRKTREEKLRMPRFDFQDAEAEAIVTFLAGLTNIEHAQEVVKTFSPVEQDIERGKRLVLRSNCRGCHVLQMQQITYEADVDGRRQPVTLQGWITQKDTENDNAWYIGLWRDEPRIGKRTSDNVGVPFDRVIRMAPFEGGGIMEQRARQACADGGKDPTSEGDLCEARLAVRFLLPPVLQGQGGKTQPDWLARFLQAPYVIRPWVEYRMPTFGFTEDEAAALVKYFYALNAGDRAVTRDGYTVVGRKTQQTEEQVRIQVARGEDVDIKAVNLARLEAEDPATLRPFPEMEAGFAERIAAASPNPLAVAKAAIFHKEKDTLRCTNCHYVGDKEPPQAMEKRGPDLARVRDRLRPDWVRRWLTDPNRIYPGTNMPTFTWGSDDYKTLFPEFLPGQTEAQVEAVKDFLFNRLQDVAPPAAAAPPAPAAPAAAQASPTPPAPAAAAPAAKPK